MSQQLPIFYSSMRSPHCFKVSLVLNEKNIHFDRVEIDLKAKEQKTPDYLALNPLGQVPVYEDDRGIHVDSLVIMEYLDERFPSPPLFPQDEEARQTVLAWIDLSSTAMRDTSHYLYWQLIEPPEGGTDWAEVTRLKQEGLELLIRVEEALRNGGGWLTGVLSAADFSAFAWIYGYARFGLPGGWEAFPNLKAWLERLAKRPSFAASYQQQGRPFSSLLRERNERHEDHER